LKSHSILLQLDLALEQPTQESKEPLFLSFLGVGKTIESAISDFPRVAGRRVVDLTEQLSARGHWATAWRSQGAIVIVGPIP
jgi:hypothetical protein